MNVSDNPNILAVHDGDERRLLLLVEDNGADVFLVEQAIDFHQVPVQLLVAEDGEAACDYFDKADADKSVPCPAILLLDLNLPKKSGTEVLEQVRKSHKCNAIPIIVLTSSDSPDDRAKAAKLGADRYFRKPTSYREFLEIGAMLNEVLKETAR
jgi:DNA-binding response OmpR family regulator